MTQSIRGISAHHGEEDMVKFMVAEASSVLADQETEMVRTKGQAFVFTRSIPVTEVVSKAPASKGSTEFRMDLYWRLGIQDVRACYIQTIARIIDLTSLHASQLQP